MSGNYYGGGGGGYPERRDEYGYGNQQGGFNQQEPPYGQQGGFNQQGYNQGGFERQNNYGQGTPYGSSDPYSQTRREDASNNFGYGENRPVLPGQGPDGRPIEGEEGERGLMGALAGGAAGAYGGHKVGHGFLGTIGGAITGSLAEDEVKKYKHNHDEQRLQQQQMQAGGYGSQGQYGQGSYNNQGPPGYSQDPYNNSGPAGYNQPPHQNPQKHGFTNTQYAAMAGGAALTAFGGYELYEHEHKKHQAEQNARYGEQSYQGGRGFEGGNQGYNQQPMGPGPGQMDGNFSGSCRDIDLHDGRELRAHCMEMGGGERHSKLHLDSCIGNENGRLVWQRDGGFSGSSKHARLVDNGRVLECELRDGNGEWRHSSLFLDERISNQDGHLTFLD